MNPLRAYLYCLSLSLLAGALPAFAQTPEQTDAGQQEEPLLRGSNRALSFTLDGLNLGAVDGGIGARWFIGQRSALRLTLRLAVESTEDVTGGEIDTGRSAFGAGTSFLVEWHTHTFRRVSPYIGAGVGVQFDAFSETTDFGPANTLRRRRNKGTAVDFFVSAGVGMEVYLSKSISLSGEHLLTAAVRSVEGEEILTFREQPEAAIPRDATAFRFGTGTSSLIISIFF